MTRSRTVGASVNLCGAMADEVSDIERLCDQGVDYEGGHPIDPVERQSHQQDTTVVTACARAARAFADGGYSVFVDGVFGPRFLEHLTEQLGDGRCAGTFRAGSFSHSSPGLPAGSSPSS